MAVAATAIHAVVATDADVPASPAGAVAAVPPLTVVLTRRLRSESVPVERELAAHAVVQPAEMAVGRHDEDDDRA